MKKILPQVLWPLIGVTFVLLFTEGLGLDPDTHRTIPQIIRAKGYPCEVHNVTTQDGYILTVYRIPHGIKGVNTNPKPVLLQHGFGSSAFAWLINMPYESLAYILADSGYDVWIGNNRGNIYSLGNTRYTPAQDEFWDFSWDSMALYDAPNMIGYILKVSGKPKLSYVGHSEGTTIMFAGQTLPLNPPLSSLVNVFVGLAPVTKLKYVESLGLKYLAEFDVGELLLLLGQHEFPPGFAMSTLREILKVFCDEEIDICNDLDSIFGGGIAGKINASRDSVYTFHNPGGTSTKNAIHWAQAVNSGKFQHFDYGPTENQKRYNQTTPPPYDLNRFPKSVPVGIFSGTKDVLADPTDVQNLYDLLKGLGINITWKVIQGYAHSDFVRDIDAYQRVYPYVVKLLDQYS